MGNHDGEEEIRIVCLGECGSREAKSKIVVVWLPKSIPASAGLPQCRCVCSSFMHRETEACRDHSLSLIHPGIRAVLPN